MFGEVYWGLSIIEQATLAGYEVLPGHLRFRLMLVSTLVNNFVVIII